MAGRVAASRELLLGLYAIEGGAIDREGLVRAVLAWSRSPEASLSEILAGRGVLDPATLARLEDRVGRDLGPPAVEPGPGLGAGVATVDRPDRPADTLAHPGTPTDGSPAGDPAADGAGGRRFRIVRSHARGGLGEVFLAFDGELNRPVAVKELQAHRAHDPAAQARFLLEAEVTGRLEHPGIVPVYSLGRHPDGRPYYAMRLIEGGTLREAIEGFHRTHGPASGREGRELAFRRLLRSVIDACNAVAYAHSRGVVHRDLKPENIMLGRFGETLVVDWGVAKPSQDAGVEGVEPPEAEGLPADASMTQPGSMIGTPRYMSPEQAGGDPGTVGASSDIYSLGAILYCVLVGHDAFPDGDLPTVLARVRRGIFPAPRRLRRSIDPALEAICLKAMSPDPGARHPSALDLAAELEAWLADVRYRVDHERALGQVKGSLARLCFERARHGFEREAHDEGMLWLARALENAPSEPPELQRAIRTSLHGWHAGAKLLERRLRHGGEVHAVDFCPEGRRLATASGDRSARLWDVATGSTLCPPLRHDGPVRAVAFAPAGDLLATAGDDGMIRRWDALTGEPLGAPIRCGSPITALGFSPDGSRIAAASGRGVPFLWDAATGLPVGDPDADGARALAVAFSPDGSTLAVACLDGDVRLLESATGRPIGPPLAHESAVPALAFDPTGAALLTGSLDGSARLWDVARMAATVTLAGQGEVRCLAFRPGGAAFATAGDEGTARLWESATGRPIGGRLEHRAPVDCLAFRPDGTMVATGSPDGMVRLWCADTGLPIGPPLAGVGAIRGLVFSRDGGRIAAAGPDPTARCWTVPNPVEAEVERISCWVRVVTGLELDEGDAIRRMDGPTGWDLRRRLNDLGGPPLR